MSSALARSAPLYLSAFASLLLASCDPSTSNQGDPCEPNGHIHRGSAEGEWCHCNRGYLPSENGLSCVVDPNYSPDRPFSFGDNGAGACWHLANGPFATVQASADQAPSVGNYQTLYTLRLRPEGGQYVGRFSFRSFETGRFIAHLGAADVPLAFFEGQLSVPVVAQQDSTACSGIRHMVGVEFYKGISYTLQFGPTSLPELNLVLTYVP
jgi:hypothetical protein